MYIPVTRSMKTGVFRGPKAWLGIVVAYLWTHKILVFYPLDIGFDVQICITHFQDNNTAWGALTALFIMLPNIIKFIAVLWTETEISGKERIIKASKYLFFLHLMTFYK